MVDEKDKASVEDSNQTEKQNQPTLQKKSEKPPRKGVVKGVTSTVKSWVSWDSLVRDTSYLTGNLRAVLKVQKPTHSESFEEAMIRLNLTEKDIEERKKNFLKLAFMMSGFGVLALLYTLYLLWNSAFGGGALALVVSLLCFATACRYHFWYFQVKNRKLGCTLHEWLNAKVSGSNE